MKQKRPVRRKVATAVALVLCSGWLISSSAIAQQPELRPKSMTTAVLLGLDPLPADALLYANKPVQAMANFLLGGLGGGLFWAGLVGKLTEKECPQCEIDGNQVAIVFGALLYFPALAWDAIGGITGVEQHNRQVQQQQISLRPIMAYHPEGTLIAGISGTF